MVAEIVKKIALGLGVWLALCIVSLAIVLVLIAMFPSGDSTGCPPGQEQISWTPAPGGGVERVGCVP